MGPLSDRYGRKWFMVANQVGYTLRPLGYLLLSLIPSHNLSTWMLALPSVPTALAGMDALAFNLVYSYAGDISHRASNRSASFRFLIIETLSYLLMPVGIYSGNFIFQNAGYIWLFASITILCGMSAIYTLFFIHNIIPHREDSEGDKEQEKTLPVKVFKILRDLVSSLTKRRSGLGRSIIIILIAILGTHAICYTCDSTITFVFLQTQLGFNENQISIIQSVRSALIGVGGLLTIGLIQLTDVNVMVIGLINCLSKLGYYLE